MTRTMRILAQVQYIDFEGRSDGESLQKILAQLKPRRVLLVRGTPESTEAMAAYCKQWTDGRVFTPSRGEVVDATTETHIYQVMF
jgi:cleavage and polyadenylation specificity factor subunit 2